MRRKLSFLLIITILMLFFSGMTPASVAVSGSSEQVAAGYWQLISIDDIIPEDDSFTTEYASAYKRNSYQQGQYAFDWGVENYDYEETVTIDGTVSASFTRPPEKIIPNQDLTFQVSLTVGHTSSVESGLFDEAVASLNFYGILANPENSTHEYRLPVTANSSVNDTASVKFLPSNGMISTMSIEMILYGLPDLGGFMQTTYNYEWVEEQQPQEPAAINLRGLSLNMIGEPMPWMKLEARVYYGLTEFDRDVSPDQTVIGITDHAGRYNLQIAAPDTAGVPVGIFLVGYLSSYFPYAEDQELFRMIDSSNSESVNNESTRLGTWILLDDKYFSNIEPGQPVNIYRLLAFYHLALGGWSVDEEFMPEPVYYFTGADTSKFAKDLEDFSILYTAAHEAWFFGGILLDEKDNLISDPVKIMLNASGISHYDARTNHISLEEICSKRDDYSAYVLMHEFGHYFDYVTNSVDNFRAASGYAEGDKNHGGYLNRSTSDSYLEGFATAYAGLVQQYSGYPAPGYIGGYVLTDPPVYKAWGTNGSEEELAIAALLYQVNMKYSDIRDFWSVISPDRLNFHEYYGAIESALNSLSGSDADWLRGFAIDAGLFKMPFGSGQYEIGEPYLDINKNNQYDPDERFADLMFDTDSNGYVLFDQPLEEYDENDLNVGKVSPANTPSNAPRYTTFQSEDSFLYLNGEPLEYVLVRFFPDRQDSYSALYYVGDNRVFIPMGSSPRTGRVEVHVPGGSLLWQESMDNIQLHKLKAAGAPIPLGEIDVKSSDLYTGNDYHTATRGMINHQGLISRPEIGSQELVNSADDFGYADINALADLRISPERRQETGGAPGAETDRVSRDDDRTNESILVVLLIFLVLLLACLAVVLIIVIRKR